MKWAIGTGFYLGSAEVVAANAGNIVERLEREITDARSSLKSCTMPQAPGASQKLSEILKRAQQLAYDGQIIAPVAADIKTLRDQWLQMLAPYADGPYQAFATGIQLGFPGGYATMRLKAPDSQQNFTAAEKNLDALKAIVPKLTVDYHSKLQEIKTMWQVATSGDSTLLTLADFIFSLFGYVQAQLPPP